MFPTLFVVICFFSSRKGFVCRKFCIFTPETSYEIIMCTVTLEYNQNSALARRKLAALLATGLFIQKDMKLDTPSPEEVEAHRQLRDAAIEHSRKSMSPIIARYL